MHDYDEELEQNEVYTIVDCSPSAFLVLWGFSIQGYYSQAKWSDVIGQLEGSYFDVDFVAHDSRILSAADFI